MHLMISDLSLTRNGCQKREIGIPN